jgi:hypothetical protein
MRTALVIVGGALLLGIGFGVGFLAGVFSGEQGTYHRQYLAERELVAPVLRDDSAFRSVQVGMRSNGGVSVHGDLPTAEAYDRLRESLLRTSGEAWVVEHLSISAPGR